MIPHTLIHKNLIQTQGKCNTQQKVVPSSTLTKQGDRIGQSHFIFQKLLTF